MSFQAETTPPIPEASLPEDSLPTPPPPPRAISDSYAWRLLLTDGWARPQRLPVFAALIDPLLASKK